VELHAVGDGTWAWARWNGVHFDPRGDGRPAHPRDVRRQLAWTARHIALGAYENDDDATGVLDDIHELGLISEQLHDRAKAALPSKRQIADGQLPAGTLLAPGAVASLGDSEPWTDADGATTWLGRELILRHGSQDWDGVLFL
jgi:hypothetical protein